MQPAEVARVLRCGTVRAQHRLLATCDAQRMNGRARLGRVAGHDDDLRPVSHESLRVRVVVPDVLGERVTLEHGPTALRELLRERSREILAGWLVAVEHSGALEAE